GRRAGFAQTSVPSSRNGADTAAGFGTIAASARVTAKTLQTPSPRRGPWSMSNPRQAAIQKIAAAQHKLERVNFKDTHVKDFFGVNVFSTAVQRQRLPKPVFKALQKTIKLGAPLDAESADAVANAMKDWAIENGATHFTH